jgi:hypothetical protein
MDPPLPNLIVNGSVDMKYVGLSQCLHFYSYNLYKYLTNSMEMSPSWEAASCSVIPEFPNILWNPKVH